MNEDLFVFRKDNKNNQIQIAGIWMKNRDGAGDAVFLCLSWEIIANVGTGLKMFVKGN